MTLLTRAYAAPTPYWADLQDALEDVSLERALWRAASGRHNIWELLLHCAFWKHIVIRWLAGHKDRADFPRQPQDFPVLPNATEENWTADKALLEKTHQTLLTRVEVFEEARLNDAIEVGRARTFAELIFGVADRDGYHAVQIRLLLVLQQGELL